MFRNFLSRIFAVSPEVIDFISDSKTNFRNKIALLIPLTGWASFFGAISPLFLKLVIDSLTNNSTSLASIELKSVWVVILVIIGGLGLINILDNLFQFLKNVLLLKINQQTQVFLEDKFSSFLTRFDSAFLGSENNLRLVRNLQFNIQSTQDKFVKLAQSSIETVVGTVTLIFVIPYIHPLLSVLILASVLLDSALDFWQNQNWRKYELLQSRQAEEKNGLNWRIIWYFNKLLENGWILQILESYKLRRAKWMKTSFSQGYNDQVFGLFRDFSTTILRVGSLLVAAWLFLNGHIAIGTLVVFQLYISQIKSQLQSFGNIFRNLFELRFELFRYDFLIHIQPKLDYTVSEKPDLSNLKSVEITNLTFTYPKFFEDEKEYLKQMKIRIGGIKPKNGGKDNLKSEPSDDQNNARDDVSNKTQKDLNKVSNKGFIKSTLDKIVLKITNNSLNVSQRKDLLEELEELEKMFLTTENNKIVLKNINLNLQQGKIYGIVGQNGAGKTTLMKLIKRTIDPTSGKIIVSNSKELKTIDPLHWKNYIGNVNQDNFLWEALTVRENLLLGLNQTEIANFTDERIFEVIKKIGLSHKITSLDLIIGENLELSGGEKQLLELARVVLQKKPLIILDEATNQLDAGKEEIVLNLLQELKQEAIIIFITHRMTTTKKCDQVIVLENGVITATGSPNQLLEAKEENLFQSFWRKQIG